MITTHETIDQLLRRLETEAARDCGAPTPDEIAEQTAAIRSRWTDKEGVLNPEVVFGDKGHGGARN